MSARRSRLSHLRRPPRVLLRLAIALAIAACSTTAALATEPRADGARARAGLPAGPTMSNPAGPSPRNAAGPSPRHPAGPTPFDAAGPTPLNAAGGFPLMGQIPGRHRAEFPASDLLQPDVFVSTVAPAAVGPLGGSFFCQIHNRGFASEQFFFEHLQAVDGLAPEVARGVLIENGGTWMFVGFPAGE